VRFLVVRPGPPTYDIALASANSRRLSPVSQQFLRIVLAR
jgi:hypothetical protein